jgi:hypothetical protein
VKDIVHLLLPRDDLIDPLGSGRRKGGDEGFHHAFVDLWSLLDEKGVLFGILQIIDDIRGKYPL